MAVYGSPIELNSPEYQRLEKEARGWLLEGVLGVVFGFTKSVDGRSMFVPIQELPLSYDTSDQAAEITRDLRKDNPNLLVVYAVKPSGVV